MRRPISDLLADEYPVSVIARRAGVLRQDIYNFLNPQKYAYRLTPEKIRAIAKFEGRSVKTVREEYERRAA